MSQRGEVQNATRPCPPENRKLSNFSAGRPPSEGPNLGMPKVNKGEILVKQTYWDYEDFMNPNIPNPPKKCYYKVMSKEEFAKRQEMCKDLEKTRFCMLQQLEKNPCASEQTALGKAAGCIEVIESGRPQQPQPSFGSPSPSLQQQPCASPAKQMMPQQPPQPQPQPRLSQELQQGSRGFQGSGTQSGEQDRCVLPPNQNRRARSLPPEMSPQLSGLPNFRSFSRPSTQDDCSPGSIANGIVRQNPLMDQRPPPQPQRTSIGQVNGQRQQCPPPMPGKQPTGDARASNPPRMCGPPPPPNSGIQNQNGYPPMRMQPRPPSGVKPPGQPIRNQSNQGYRPSQSPMGSPKPCLPAPRTSGPSAGARISQQPIQRPSGQQCMTPPEQSRMPPLGQNIQRTSISRTGIPKPGPGQGGVRPPAQRTGMVPRQAPTRNVNPYMAAPPPLQRPPPCEGNVPPQRASFASGGPNGQRQQQAVMGAGKPVRPENQSPPCEQPGQQTVPAQGPRKPSFSAPIRNQGGQGPVKNAMRPCPSPQQQLQQQQHSANYPPSQKQEPQQNTNCPPAEHLQNMNSLPQQQSVNCPPGQQRQQQQMNCPPQKQQIKCSAPPPQQQFVAPSQPCPPTPKQQPCSPPLQRQQQNCPPSQPMQTRRISANICPDPKPVQYENVNAALCEETPPSNFVESEDDCEENTSQSNSRSACDDQDMDYNDNTDDCTDTDDQGQWDSSKFPDDYNGEMVCDEQMPEYSSYEEDQYEEEPPKPNPNPRMNTNNLQIIIQIPQQQAMAPLITQQQNAAPLPDITADNGEECDDYGLSYSEADYCGDYDDEQAVDYNNNEPYCDGDLIDYYDPMDEPDLMQFHSTNDVCN